MSNIELTHMSLFTGVGGMDLAAEWAGFKTVGQCEWADYPTKVLEKNWPGVPRWRDIRSVNKESFTERTGLGTVDVVSGGFPCQPFSVAGKQRGSTDDRYLWPEMLRVISELKPTWVIGENVPGIVNMALEQVLSDLEGQGYEVQTLLIPACGVDAPHRRERVFIVAHAIRRGRGENRQQGGVVGISGERENDTSEVTESSANVAHTNGTRELQQGGSVEEFRGRTGNESKNVAYTHDTGLEGRNSEIVSERPGELSFGKSGSYVPDAIHHGLHCAGWDEAESRGHEPKNRVSFRNDYWDIEPDVGRVAHGVPKRVDRLKCLGNAVVPLQVYPIFRFIADIEGDAP